MEEKSRNIPEDVLNLELKFLDENVRPYITHVVDSWAGYMKKENPANHIIINIQTLLWQLRPVGRLTKHELEGFENRNKELQKILKSENNREFDRTLLKLVNDVYDKISATKMFARPSEETTSGLSALMKQMEKEEKEEKEKEDGV